MLDWPHFYPLSHDRAASLTRPLGSGSIDALLLIARILMGYIFLLSGWGKLMSLAGFATYLEQHGVPSSNAFAVLGATVEFGVGLTLALGVATRYAALMTIAFVFVATGISHRFWEFEGVARTPQAINFNKNMAMVGGLITLIIAGPGRYSLDRLLARLSQRHTRPARM
jgi:putative oxidoreductase